MSYIVYMKLGDKKIKLNKNNNGENNMNKKVNEIKSIKKRIYDINSKNSEVK